MTLNISRDTQLCMSLSGRPGNFGTRFHNFLYQELGLDYVYKAFTTTDLAAAIGGVRALGIRGCAVSMPFKERCIALLDDLDDTARAINSVNTIVNTAGQLRGYNTDYSAVRQLIEERGLSPNTPLVLRGSGGMAKAVACAFRDAGFKSATIWARNEQSGRALASSLGYTWQAQWSAQEAGATSPILINVTPLGMSGPQEGELAFTPAAVQHAQTVFDVVALPAETPLIREARAQGKAVISGAEVIVRQAVEQFVLYTGVQPSAEQMQRAGTFARGDTQGKERP